MRDAAAVAVANGRDREQVSAIIIRFVTNRRGTGRRRTSVSRSLTWQDAHHHHCRRRTRHGDARNLVSRC